MEMHANEFQQVIKMEKIEDRIACKTDINQKGHCSYAKLSCPCNVSKCACNSPCIKKKPLKLIAKELEPKEKIWLET